MSVVSLATPAGVPATATLPVSVITVAGPTAERSSGAWRGIAATAASVLIAGAVAAMVIVEVVHALPTIAAGRGRAQIWLVGTAACGAATYLCNAVELRAAAGLTYPLRDGFAGQLAAAFGNRVLPAGLGAVGVNIRFLERAGLERTRAITSLAVTKIVGAVAHTGILALALGLGAAGAVDARLPMPAPGRLALAVLSAAAAGLALLAVAKRGFFARVVAPRVRLAGRQVATLLSCPRTAATVTLAAAGGKLTHVAGLATALAAFGLYPSPFTVTAVYLAGSCVAAAVPTPGGIGTTEAALVAGLAAAGEPAGLAIAAVVAFRLVTTWLPVVPGGALFLALRRRGAL